MRLRHSKKNLAALAAVLVFSSTLLGSQVNAAPSYDAYADSVATSSGVGAALLQNDDNAVGAPDGNTVGLVGVNSSITLDMGEGEEGTGNLILHSGLLELAVSLRVEFLDSSSNVIKTDQQTLAISLGEEREFEYSYAQYSKAYRFVRITNLVTGALNLDAVEAMSYIGMNDTVDTDQGGMPDRREQNEFGTNPQNPADDNIATSNPPVTPPAGNNGSDNENTDVDTDNDGMPDNYETDNGLNPEVDDSKEDPDNDGITNLFEYKKGSNPRVADEFSLGICTAKDGENAEAQANMFRAFTLLFLVLFLASLGGMLYYRNKYVNRNKSVVTNS